MLKYFPLIIIILTVSCSGSKALLKKGTTLEHNKQYVEASNYYFESLSRNNSNVDALVALNRVGKKVLNQYLEELRKIHAVSQKPVVLHLNGDFLTLNSLDVGKLTLYLIKESILL